MKMNVLNKLMIDPGHLTKICLKKMISVSLRALNKEIQEESEMKI